MPLRQTRALHIFLDVEIFRAKPGSAMTNSKEPKGGENESTGSMAQSSAAATSSTASIHDSLFYKLFGDAKRAAAELACVLPEALVKVIDWSTLKIEPNRFVDLNLANHFADIWLSVRVKRKKVAIHLLFEHSSGPKNHELLQALRYQVKFWEKEEKPANEDGFRPLTPILTVILHHSEKGWRGRSRFAEYLGLDEELAAIFRPFVADFGVFVDDLSPLDADVLLERPVPIEVHVMLFALRFGRNGEELLGELPKIAPLLAKLLDDARGRLVVHSFLAYIKKIGKGPEAQLRMALPDVYKPVLHPAIAELWEPFEAGVEEGERRGEQRGEQRGIVKGKVTTLERILTQRFGPLPSDAAAWLKQASLEDLEGIELRVLAAKTLHEALGLAKKKKR